MIPGMLSPDSSPAASLPETPRPGCHHVSRNGRPCRYLAVPAKQPFCRDHLPTGCPEQLSDVLSEMAENFNSPEGVTNVLYTIFFALVDGYISERKAGILTYIAQTTLNSHRATAFLQKLEAEAEPKLWPMGPGSPLWTPPDSSDDPKPSVPGASAESANPLAASDAKSSSSEAAPSAAPESTQGKPEDPSAPSPAAKPSPKKVTA